SDPFLKLLPSQSNLEIDWCPAGYYYINQNSSCFYTSNFELRVTTDDQDYYSSTRFEYLCEESHCCGCRDSCGVNVGCAKCQPKDRKIGVGNLTTDCCTMMWFSTDLKDSKLKLVWAPDTPKEMQTLLEKQAEFRKRRKNAWMESKELGLVVEQEKVV